VSGQDRIAARFAALEAEGRGGFVAFITAGDPDEATALSILKGLPAAGADVIELGMPFTDPVADGPAIQLASQRALANGMTLRRTLETVTAFRADEAETPLVLMGYFNPIYAYGCEAFARDAAQAGVDGVIVVDLPPEEDAELREPLAAAGIHLIRLIAPTTGEERLPVVLKDAGGFVYLVAVAGITGAKSATLADIEQALARLRRHTTLPVAVGFGIRTPEQAAEVARRADAAVVGTALVARIAEGLDAKGRAKKELAAGVLGAVEALAGAVRTARKKQAEKA
jgi:tryptophan synthase alpha chain